MKEPGEGPDGDRVAEHLRGNVVGYVALFLALSGGAYAVSMAPRNSVTTKSVKNGTLTGGDVKDDSLTGADVNEATLNGVQGPQGLTGPPGSDGSPDTPAQVLAKLAGVDGAGSGLDADTLDGIDSGAFLQSIPNGSVTADKVAVLPAVRATGSCGVVSQAVNTPVVFSTEDFDTTGTMHTTSSCATPAAASSQLVAPRAGIYQVNTGIVWGDQGKAGERAMFLRRTAGGPTVTYFAASSMPSAGATSNGTVQTVSALISLNQGDYVEALVWQAASGGNLPLGNGTEDFLDMHWVSPIS